MQEYLGQDKWGDCISTEAFRYVEMGYMLEALEFVSSSLSWAYRGRDNLVRGILAVFRPKDTVTGIFGRGQSTVGAFGSGTFWS